MDATHAVAAAADSGMGFNDIIMWILAFGALVGGADVIMGNKLGLGEKFEEGFHAMGPLALAMVGIICLAPVLADVLRPIVVPVFTAMNADPSAFAGLLPNDAGGYPLALLLADGNKEVAAYPGLLVGSMIGCALGLLIPMALGMLEKHDQPYFAKGLLLGIIVVPFASFLGGLIGMNTGGYTISFLFWNTLPILLVSIILVIGLMTVPSVMLKASMLFGRIIAIVVAVGLTCAAFKFLTGAEGNAETGAAPGIDIINWVFTKIDLAGILGIEKIAKMDPVMVGMEIIGIIGVVLLGTFPTMFLLIKILRGPLEVIGSKLGLDSTSTGGIIITCANPVPTLKMIKDMNSRGKILNCAFTVTTATALGDHLGFTAAMDNRFVPMVVLGKLIGGALVIVLTLMWTKSTELEDLKSEEIKREIAAKGGVDVATE